MLDKIDLAEENWEAKWDAREEYIENSELSEISEKETEELYEKAFPEADGEEEWFLEDLVIVYEEDEPDHTGN